jgi:hypothetical protein
MSSVEDFQTSIFEPLLVAISSVHSSVPYLVLGAKNLKAGWADGRRKYGEASVTIKAVLTQNGDVMRMRDIHAAVEHLGGEVSFQSVADYLVKNSRGPRPFVREAAVWTLSAPAVQAWLDGSNR